MADNKSSARGKDLGPVAGVTAGAFTGTLIANLLNKPVSAETDEALRELVANIAQNTADSLDLLNEIAAKDFGTGVPPNTDNFITFDILIRNANTPQQLPSYKIPDGFSCVFLSHPTLNPAGSVIAVARDPNTALRGVFPLVPGTSIGLKITDTSLVYVNASIANLTICVIGEYGG